MAEQLNNMAEQMNDVEEQINNMILPESVISAILGKLPIGFVIENCFNVSKSWRKCKINLQSLTINRRQSPQHVKKIAEKIITKKLTSLNVSKHDVLNHIDVIKTFSYLQVLSFSYCYGVSKFNLFEQNDIGFLSNLRILDLTNLSEEITNNSLVTISSLAKLQNLNLSKCIHVTDEGMVHVSLLKHLRSLVLHHCYKLTDIGLRHISSLSALRNLDLSCCTNITDDGLGHIGKLTLLRVLNLYACTNVTDEGLFHIRFLINLQILNISLLREITNDGLLNVCHFKNLHVLDLYGCKKITADGLSHFNHNGQLDIIISFIGHSGVQC